MKPIQKLHINYFKFFTDNTPIELNGKHLLIYGENGSGKSSIYWALYTLLEAVYKSDSEQNKYFDPVGNAESLLNLYTPTPTDSFIGLELADGKTYRIALNDFSIRAEANADATARASDFLNYRFMFRLIDFRHREEIDLFRLFEKEVFPYIKTRSKFTLIHTPKDSFDFNEIWDDLKKGARRPTVFDGPIPSPTPTPTPTTTFNYNQLQKEYADLLRRFVGEVNSLAQQINLEGNGILQQGFGYQSIRFEVACIQKFSTVAGGGELAGRESDNPEGYPKIKLLIPEYEGLQNVVKKPQSFLNEAKLTAIGIAIRLAILSRRLDYADGADFQLLVLDDLLISLDMSNRRKVLDLLLNRYAQDFQLIVLTHDRAFYEKTKRQIVTAGQEGEWLHFEMYEDTRTTPSKPFIKKSESFIDNAIKHFHEFEFPAAANSLRKACEELLYELLPPHQIYTKEMSKIWQLDNLLAKAETYYKSFPISYQPILEIREYVKTLMNPLSHSDLESPVYRQELNDVFVQFQKLSQYKNLQTKKLLDAGDKLYYSLRDHRTKEDLSFEIELLEELSYHFIENYTKSLGFAKFRCFWSKNGERQKKPISENDLTKFLKYVEKKTDNSNLDVWGILSKADGTKLIDLI